MKTHCTKVKTKIPKSVRIRLVSAVRCAIRMRSGENDKVTAVKSLEHDIRNSVHHIYGDHSRCSDFCKSRPDRNSKSLDDVEPSENSIPDVIEGVSQIWKDTTSIEMQENARLCTNNSINLDALMLRDISILLDRVASKSKRLMGNHTTNLAESWMSVRAKFDGGKLYNRCNRGSWHLRCFGGSLRLNLGPQWSPNVWEKTTKTSAGQLFRKLYTTRDNALKLCKQSKLKPEVKAKRLKRKHEELRLANTKKAKLDYGPDAADSSPDITPAELETQKQKFLAKHINLDLEKILFIENNTKQQSASAIWIDERTKRLTASNFGLIVRRNPSIPVKKLVHSLLYSTFHGNSHTKKGLMEETMTIKEYVAHREKENVNINVQNMGLTICRHNKFLAATPDGKITEKEENGNISVGLLEIKNLLHSKPIDLIEGAKKIKNFCLQLNDKELSLKKNHLYYYQVQGQLNVTKLPWADFVVRTLNPYQIHIERIYIDEHFWNMTMLPKLTAFYHTVLLPELASPRNKTLNGIREPGVWYDQRKITKKTETQRKSHKDTRRKTTSQSIGEDNSIHQPQTLLPSSSFSQEVCRSRRCTKVKFLGRRISHEWVEDESSNLRKWYNGTVLSLTKGKDGDPSAVYEVIYDGEDEPYTIDHLIEDYKSSSVKFIDI